MVIRQPPSGNFAQEDKVPRTVVSPLEAFMKMYSQVWKPIKFDPPRGCVAVSGLVELETSKAWIVIDVFAWYNPKTRAFDENTLWLPVRRMQYKKQSPLR
jgi:hypothetical protein